MALRIRDDLNRDVLIAHSPRRVVSLVPSETETLFALGLGERLVGRTRYCIEPAAQVSAVPTVGGTKDIDVDAVLALAPDLVLANQEENTRQALEAIAQRGVPTFVSFPRRVADGVGLVARIARIFEVTREVQVVEWMAAAYALLRDAEAAVVSSSAVRAFVPIWMNPLMTISGDTYGSDMLRLAGADNVFADRQRRYPLAADLGKRGELPPELVEARDRRYPRITLGELEQRRPEIILLPDEPHAFSEEDARVLAGADTPAGRAGAVGPCDGQDLFWYGTRVLEGLPRLRDRVADLAARATCI